MGEGALHPVNFKFPNGFGQDPNRGPDRRRFRDTTTRVGRRDGGQLNCQSRILVSLNRRGIPVHIEKKGEKKNK